MDYAYHSEACEERQDGLKKMLRAAERIAFANHKGVPTTQVILETDIEISELKTTVEQRSRLSLLEIILYDTACLERVPSTPTIPPDPNISTAWSTRKVAQHITGGKINEKDSLKAQGEEDSQG